MNTQPPGRSQREGVRPPSLLTSENTRGGSIIERCYSSSAAIANGAIKRGIRVRRNSFMMENYQVSRAMSTRL